MPSEVYFNLNDEDMGYLIAYLKSLPPVDKQNPDRRIGPMGRVLLVTGQFPSSAELVEKLPPRSSAVAPGPSAEYGAYLASTVCVLCHGQNLAGEYFPPGSPDAKLTPNLTPGGELLIWSQADFVKAMRTGVTKDGDTLDQAQMPWKELGQMSDDELAAIYAYLKSLPKTPAPAKS
jgi:mono/diheme cytochrome c family protein